MPPAILTDESEAGDVMQQAYVNAYSYLRQFDGHSLRSGRDHDNWARLVDIGSERDERG